jgi:hypothetical protein
VRDEYDFTHAERGKYFGRFLGEELAGLRTEIRRGATHDCGEWVIDGRCLLCDALVVECTCRNLVCEHGASFHRGPGGACVVPGCPCGPGGWM